MNRVAAIGFLLLGCQRYTSPEQRFVERSQWSRTEMDEYEAVCIRRQPTGVRTEDAELFCTCKTLGLAVRSSSPKAAERSVHPTDEDRAEFRRTGNVPDGYAQY